MVLLTLQAAAHLATEWATNVYYMHGRVINCHNDLPNFYFYFFSPNFQGNYQVVWSTRSQFANVVLWTYRNKTIGKNI